MNKIIAMLPDVSMWVQNKARKLLQVLRAIKHVCDQLMRA
jgi:hypothetical protein